MPIGDLGPELAVLIAAVLTLLLAMVLPQRRLGLCLWLALAGLAVAGVLAAAQLGAWRMTFSGTFALDGATIWARLLILGATALCLLLAPRWFARDTRHGEFYAMALFSTVGAMAIAGAADLMQLMMGVLLSSITGYVLAAYHRDWEISVEAGMKYFLLGALVNGVMVLGIVFVQGTLGTTDYQMLAAGGRGAVSGALGPLSLLGVMLVLLGLLFKLGAVPAHPWVPDVTEGAPVPAAAFLTTVPKIAGAVAMFRLVQMLPAGPALGLSVAIFAAATMTLGNLAALWQDDLRRLIGWSSVAQAGYALMAVAVAGRAPEALPALLVFMGAYALANIGALALVADMRGRTALDDWSGLGRRMPVHMAALGVAFLSLVGIPPLLGFFGKFALFVATLEGGMAWLTLFGVANSVLSLFFYLRVLGKMLFGTATPDADVQRLGGAACWVMVTATLLVGLGALGLGAVWTLLPEATLPLP
ncbi:NADH-quinone oxidoreductase subunit N [Brevirhabdus sp.]|uniref:NADH-quinone oxidoreductase subunit N n=1 Tax=Brevirhabdus sp. TaxID=2004514 RepID=UPI0040582744